MEIEETTGASTHQTAAFSYFGAIWDYAKNTYQGLQKFSKLAMQSNSYLGDELATEALNGDGTATVPIYYNPADSRIKYITVVTKPSIISAILKTGTEEEEDQRKTRLPFEKFKDILNTDSLINHANGYKVNEDRKNIKFVLNDLKRFKPLVEEHFGKWVEEFSSEDDLERSIKKAVYFIVGRAALGIENFPSDLDTMIDLLDRLDELLNCEPENKSEIQNILSKLTSFSNEMHAANKESLENTRNFPKDVGGENLKNINLTAGFLAAINVSKLITFAILRLADNQEMQQKLRDVLKNRNENEELWNNPFVKNLTKELERTSLAAFIPRFSNCELKVEEKIFPAGTLFIIPIRRVHYNPEYYNNPEDFNPERFSDSTLGQNKIGIHSEKFMPFSRHRVCPGHMFTEMCLALTLDTIFRNHNLKFKEGQSLETFPIKTNFLKLQKKYQGTLVEVEACEKDKEGADFSLSPTFTQKFNDLRLQRNREVEQEQKSQKIQPTFSS